MNMGMAQDASESKVYYKGKSRIKLKGMLRKE